MIGASFLFLGIIGLFVPVLQGVLFIVIGLLCLSKGSAAIRSQKIGFKRKFPKFGAKLTWMEEKARAWGKRRKKKNH